MTGIDFIEEIRIAQFWRTQLGEYEYIHYNEEDLRRWFIALETRGPAEIRDFLTERHGRFPRNVVTGVVSLAPHPPLAIVELWLSSTNRVRTMPYWIGAAVFLILAYLSATNLQGCTTLVDPNQLATSPPQMQAPIAAAIAGPPSPPASTLPTTPLTPPANLAARPTGGTGH